MVKRMKKAKTTCEVAMIAKAASLGVCTRAKTMELKKSSSSHSTSTIIEGTTTIKVGDGCYLQLRSGRLERHAPPFAKKAKKNKCTHKEKDIDLQKENVGINFEKKPNDKKGIASRKKEGENGVVEKQGKEFERGGKNKNEEKDDYDEKDEGSFGENDLEFENKESGRITRESTPSSFIVGSDVSNTPMSNNRATTNINTIKEMENEVPIMLSAEELEEFFAKAEKWQIEKFIKKYNFDPVNEKPLKGRYEWVKIKP